jgi:hypothetical protein
VAHSRWRRRQSGQSIVVVALSLVALVVGSGFVIDGGFAFSEQRATQNAADSASRAGALVLARKAGEGSTSTQTSAQWDESVRLAVLNSALINKTTVQGAFYTDWQGTQLGPSVGSGSVPGGAAGVRVIARKQPGTYLVRVVGLNSWNILQEATAVSGPSAGCEETLAGCQLLPIAFPVTIYSCTNNGKSLPIDPPQEWDFGQELILPICGGNPGSVGWIDWTPKSGGTSEIVDVVNTPPNVNVPLPSWQWITQTGGVSAAGLEDALNQYAGDIVQVPIFDSTCGDDPVNNLTSGCPTTDPGNGQNQWYHVVKFLSFQLSSPRGAYINGNNTSVCGLNATQCLTGRFVTFVTEGTVGGPCVGDCPIGTTFSVQLIK